MGAVGQGQFPAGDGPDAQAVGESRVLQRPAEVRVGQGEGRVSMLLRLGKQLVRVGSPNSKGEKALGVKLGVPGLHQALCRYQRSPPRSRNRVTSLPLPGSIR